MSKELRVILVLALVAGLGTVADSCSAHRPHLAPTTFPTVEVAVHNETPNTIRLALERCGFAAQYVGGVLPYRTDTFFIPSRIAPPGSAVSFRARDEYTDEHFTSLILSLPPRADWPLLADWHLRTQRVEARRAR